MKIMGCDFHPSYQQIAMVDKETGEMREVRLGHAGGEARRFYEQLQGQEVLVGMEAVGNSQWFETVLEELGHQLWIGDAAQIRRLVVRRQKTDRRDAQHILQLLLDGRFPRLWVPSAEMRDVRQLLRHRQKLVEMRTQVKNHPQHLALNQAVQRKRRLWSKEGRAVLEKLPLQGWTQQRRNDLLVMLDGLEDQVAELNGTPGSGAAAGSAAVDDSSRSRAGGGTGVCADHRTAWAFSAGETGGQLFGTDPKEHSSGGRQKLGAISKQGNTLMRILLVEAWQTAARVDVELRRDYGRLKARKHAALAKVMVARKLAVRLYWMLRENKPYTQRAVARMQDSSSHSVVAG